MKIDEDLIVTKALLRRFLAEAMTDNGDGRHYGIIRRNDGSILGHNPCSPELSFDQMLWAVDVLTYLNREIHHDGAWVVVFTNPLPPDVDNILIDPKQAEYGRYVLLWLDKDGDVQIPIEWEVGSSEMRTFADVMLGGLHATAVRAETAWHLWKLHMRDVLDPQPDQLFKAAQGQMAPSATRH